MCREAALTAPLPRLAEELRLNEWRDVANKPGHYRFLHFEFGAGAEPQVKQFHLREPITVLPTI